jgi:hypothetical protein
MAGFVDVNEFEKSAAVDIRRLNSIRPGRIGA